MAGTALFSIIQKGASIEEEDVKLGHHGERKALG